MGSKAEVQDVDTQQLDDDLFNAAFDEAVGGVDDTDPEPKPELKTELEPVEVKAEQDPEPPKAPEVDVKAIVAEAVAAAKAAEPVPPKVEPAPAAPPGPSPEELEAEEQFRKDWPEHVVREEKLKSEIAELKKTLDEALQSINGKLAPVVESAATTAQERHLQYITNAHADALEIVPEVEKWVLTQPKFLQPQYNKVLENGTAQEVVELFDLYKTNTGVGTQKDAAAEAAAAAAQAEKAARLKKMEAPATVRTSVTSEPDPQDFDSAFEAEAKKYKVA
jgi:hypothetical protein